MTTTTLDETTETPHTPSQGPSAEEVAWAEDYARAVVTMLWRMQDHLDQLRARDAEEAAEDERRWRRRQARRWR